MSRSIRVQNLDNELQAIPNSAGTTFATATIGGTAVPMVGAGGVFAALIEYAGTTNATTHIEFSIETANVRKRSDGAAPTATVGIQVQPGVYTMSIGEAMTAQFIAVGANATINAQLCYTK
jgi:hypothetical protein